MAARSRSSERGDLESLWKRLSGASLILLLCSSVESGEAFFLEGENKPFQEIKRVVMTLCGEAVFVVVVGNFKRRCWCVVVFNTFPRSEENDREIVRDAGLHRFICFLEK